MTEFENTFNAVYKVTGICRTKVRSRSRTWPIQEARMLFVLFLARRGHDDQRIAWALERNRTTVLKARHTAEDYIKVSSSFFDKFQNVSKVYAAG